MFHYNAYPLSALLSWEELDSLDQTLFSDPECFIPRFWILGEVGQLPPDEDTSRELVVADLCTKITNFIAMYTDLKFPNLYEVLLTRADDWSIQLLRDLTSSFQSHEIVWRLEMVPPSLSCCDHCCCYMCCPHQRTQNLHQWREQVVHRSHVYKTTSSRSPWKTAPCILDYCRIGVFILSLPYARS